MLTIYTQVQIKFKNFVVFTVLPNMQLATQTLTYANLNLILPTLLTYTPRMKSLNSADKELNSTKVLRIARNKLDDRFMFSIYYHWLVNF